MRCTIPDSRRLSFTTSCQRILRFPGETRNSKAYKKYYAIATGEAAPKPKASIRRTRSSSDTSITPTTAAASPRLIASAKGKQTAKASKDKSLSALSEVAMTEAQQLKLVTKRSMQQTHISQPSGSGADEGTGDDNEEQDDDGDEEDEGDDGEKGNGDDDDEDDDGDEGDDDDDQEVERDDDKDDDEEGGDDEQEYDDEEFAEETRDEESFDPIQQTPKNSENEGDGEEDQGLNISKEERRVEEEEEDELYRDVNINQGRGIQATLEVEDSHVTLTPVNPDAQRENDEFLKTVDENIKKIIKEQVKEQVKVQVSKILPRIEQAVNEQLEAEVITRSSHSSKTSYAVAADLSEMKPKKILIEKMECNKSIQRSDEQRNLYKALDEEPSAGPDRGSKRRREGNEPESASALIKTVTRSAGRSTQGSRSRQASASESAIVEEPMQTTSQMEEPSHLEFDIAQGGYIDTRTSSILINRLKVDTLTPELLAGPTYELMKGSCKSLVELEYHLEEVFKATTDQLSASSRKYTTFITKTKAADYRHIKWIEDLVPRTKWIKEPIGYDKHALWGVSHWGRKRQQFYGFAVNRESASDVYSKKRIIAVTKLKIVEWHSYKHLDWITVRRDDDKLYMFKEGDFKRLRIQDIKDMLLLLVQGKLTNLTVEERFSFNVSLQMFTRSIIIQRRVEDLQLGVESYQKKLNLTKSDTYRSDLKCKEAYTAYSNLRGFIYQNKDKKNRLMRINEIHKFSDGTLTDVRTALDDSLKGI
nr:hypothetical protein [Tanacetum cinerariifolium]